MLLDAYNRQITDLRISLTDRCNFRCVYCLPHGTPVFADRDDLLTIDEIVEIAEIFVSLGIEKIRLTGGEPLVRRDFLLLVERLADLRPRLKDLALTTNGLLLAEIAANLKRAGLTRLTISLDTLRRDRFIAMTRVDALDKTIDAIRVACDVGFDPVKVNAVVIRGRNDDELVDLARFARENSVVMRFIEYMPLDSGHRWDRDLVVSGRKIHNVIDAAFPLSPLEVDRGSSTAWRYAFADGSPGEVGIIAPVTDMFCGQCSRIRLTADGQLRTCLFSTAEHDLRGPLRAGASSKELIGLIQNAVSQKEPRHRINDAEFVQPARTMSFIGG